MATRKYTFRLTAREVAEHMGFQQSSVAVKYDGDDVTITTATTLSTAQKAKLDDLVQNWSRGHPKSPKGTEDSPNVISVALKRAQGKVNTELESFLERAIDVMERIQQQLAKINEDENLKPGERYYE